MRKALISALLLVFLSVVLGATVFRENVAQAASTLNVVVRNDAANPVPVRQQGTVDVNMTTQPVTFRLDTLDTTWQVPAGKRLVIQYVNGYSNESRLSVVSEGIGQLSHPFHFVGTLNLGQYHVSEQVTIYSYPGSTSGSVRLFLGQGNGLVTINGYLIDA
jgi:hypothetical protein